jgi:septum formation topological specificity factor MinE
LKREYELIFGVEFSIEYSLCINEFLENKIKSNETKYNILKIILQENRINILFGDDENYLETLRNNLRI